MLIIFIYGLPDDFHEEKNLKSGIMRVIVEIKELRFSPVDLSIFFPKDRLKPIDGLGEEVIIFVEQFYGKLEITAEERNNLADKLAQEVSVFFPYSNIKCCVNLFSSEAGYAVLGPKKVIETTM